MNIGNTTHSGNYSRDFSYLSNYVDSMYLTAFCWDGITPFFEALPFNGPLNTPSSGCGATLGLYSYVSHQLILAPTDCDPDIVIADNGIIYVCFLYDDASGRKVILNKYVPSTFYYSPPDFHVCYSATPTSSTIVSGSGSGMIACKNPNIDIVDNDVVFVWENAGSIYGRILENGSSLSIITTVAFAGNGIQYHRPDISIKQSSLNITITYVGDNIGSQKSNLFLNNSNYYSFKYGSPGAQQLLFSSNGTNTLGSPRATTNTFYQVQYQDDYAVVVDQHIPGENNIYLFTQTEGISSSNNVASYINTMWNGEPVVDYVEDRYVVAWPNHTIGGAPLQRILAKVMTVSSLEMYPGTYQIVSKNQGYYTAPAISSKYLDYIYDPNPDLQYFRPILFSYYKEFAHNVVYKLSNINNVHFKKDFFNNKEVTNTNKVFMVCLADKLKIQSIRPIECIQLYNISGQLLNSFNYKGQNQHNIDIPLYKKYASGLYIVRLYDNIDGEVTNKMFFYK